MPYGFYTITRLVACAICTYVAVQASKRERHGWTWLFGGLAIVYNPLLPLRLGSKPMWTAVNAATVVALLVASAMLPRGTTPSGHQGGEPR
jgi:hypothetical protein